MIMNSMQIVMERDKITITLMMVVRTYGHFNLSGNGNLLNDYPNCP